MALIELFKILISLLDQQVRMNMKIIIPSLYMKFVRQLFNGGVKINRENVGQGCHIWTTIVMIIQPVRDGVSSFELRWRRW
jgi:hypothetical protein